ncbi:glycosyltransferase family 2 protein [Candidatus Omnitrophota bacterium]
MEKNKGISLVIPAYNEGRNIRNAMLMNKQTLDSLNLDYEILVIDDGSSDSTAKIAKQLCKDNPRLQLISNAHNLGFGGAIKKGISLADKDYVIAVPCDSPLEAEELARFLDKMKKCDIIVSYRRQRKGYSKYMLFNSFVYNKILIPLLFNLGLKDANWVQMYRRSIFETGLINIEYEGIFMLVEVIYKARQKDLIIGEVPADMKRRIYGTPTSVKLKVILQTFYDMMEFWLRIRLRKV